MQLEAEQRQICQGIVTSFETFFLEFGEVVLITSCYRSLQQRFWKIFAVFLIAMNYLLHSCCVQFSANQFALHTFLLDHQLWANQSWGFVYCRRQGKIFVYFGIIEIYWFWTKLFHYCAYYLYIFTHRIVFFKFGWILYLWGKSFVLQCSFTLGLPSEIWLLNQA